MGLIFWQFIPSCFASKNTTRLPLTLVVLCLISLTLKAENARFKKLDVSDGLPFNSVRAITQDNFGYIWFGTEIGLGRYDGYTLKSYLADNNKSNSIADPYILALEVDENNTLWVGGENGLSRYNRDTDDFTVFEHDKNNPNSLSSNHIRAILYDRNGFLLVATAKGLDLFDTKNNQFTHYFHSPSDPLSLPHNGIRSLLKTKNGELYIGTNSGLAFFDRVKGSFKTINLREGNQPLIRSLAQSHTGQIWVGTHDGLFKYNPLIPKVKKIAFEKDVKYVLSVLVDYDDNLWIGTFNHGIFRIDKYNKMINMKPDKSDATALSDTIIFSLYQDQSANIWIGTRNSGVNFFHPDNLLLGSYNNSVNSFFCLPSTDIRSALALSNNKVLIGTLAGLTELDLNQKSCKNYTSNHQDINSLSHNEVYTINKINADEVWVGSSDGGFDKFNPQKGTFEQFGESLNGRDTLNILNHNDFFILGTSKGLHKFHRPTKTIFEIPVENIFLKEALIYAIDRDEKGTIWVASDKGLLTIDNQLNKVHQVKYKDSSFSGKDIKALIIDKTDKIWLTIYGEGLFIFQPETKTLIAAGEKLGLQLKAGFSGLYSDHLDNLWIATLTQGLFKIDKTRKKLTNYHVSDGLHNEVFNWFAFTQFPDGRLLFGGQSGFNLFDPVKVKTNLTPPIVSLTQLKRYGKNVIPHQDYDGFSIDRHISELAQLNLSYNDLVFGFDFVAMHYSDPDKITYAYKLQGFDQDWIYTSAQNRGITYNNMDPGEYTFHLKAQSKNGIWSEQNVALKINITPAPWLTWWAFTAYTLTFILAVFIFIKMRTQILEEHAKNLQQTVSERTQELVAEKNKVEQLLSKKIEEFANVSHEFRTPLTLILGPIAQMLNTAQSKQEINRLNIVQRNGYRLLRMVDQLLNLETFRVRFMAPKAPQASGKIIRLLTETFVDIANEKNIQLTIKDIININLEFTPDALEKIILNLLSNAIKYTKANGSITVKTSRTSNNELRIQVADTGIGIPADKINSVFERYNRVHDENSEQVTGAGIGLALVKELVESHQGTILVISKVGEGTSITIDLPIIGEVDFIKSNDTRNDEIIAMELMSLTSQSATSIDNTHEVNQTVNNSKPLVLVIEDNLDMCNYIAENIKENYQIITANDGEKGVKLAIAEVPDLIISDIMMPKMDGYETTHTLRNNSITNHIPIILLTARGDRESRLKGWYKKADEYLTKPFDVEELKIRLKNLLEIRNILKKQFAETVFQPPTQTLENNESELESIKKKQQEKFILKLNQIIETLYIEPSTSVIEISKAISMSERQLFRKMRSILDMTPAEYLRRFRLEKAKQLLIQEKSVSFTTFEVGFSSQSYFSKCFREQFGFSPKQINEMEE